MKLSDVVDQQIVDKLDGLLALAALSGYSVDSGDFTKVDKDMWYGLYGFYSGDQVGYSLDFKYTGGKLYYGVMKLNGWMETTYPVWSDKSLEELVDWLEGEIVNERI